jgi:GNAT superfamily N-acetyltransferase
MKGLEIRRLEDVEITLLHDLTPDTWTYDLAGFFRKYFEQPFFHAIVAVIDGKLVGTAEGIVNGNVGWLGNVIVAPEFRRRGIGFELARTMMDILRSLGCDLLLLIATEMGEKLYPKLGFATGTSYRSFTGGELAEHANDMEIRPISARDLPDILELDREITREDRALFIKTGCSTGWICDDVRSRGLSGYFLPDLGEGLIVASSAEAGLRLLYVKHRLFERTTVIPEQNEVAAEFLLDNGFEERTGAKRMFLGKELDWKPEKLFSRIGGYCG